MTFVSRDCVELDVVLPATSSVGPFWIDANSRRQAGASFDELPRTKLCAGTSETLREVLGRAGDDLGIGLLSIERVNTRRRRFWPRRKPEPWEEMTSEPKNRAAEGRFEGYLRFAAFVRPGDEENGPAVASDKRLHLRRIAAVDRDGIARWTEKPLDVSLDDLLRADRAGLIDGDPLRPYLIIAVPAGDPGVMADWRALNDALAMAWEVIANLTVGYSAWQLLEVIRGRLGGAKSTVESREREWGERGLRPPDLATILNVRPRSTEEVSSLLACSDSEAEALLWGLGFTEGGDGMWARSSTPVPEDAVLGRVMELLLTTSPADLEVVRSEIEDLLQTSKDPPKDD